MVLDARSESAGRGTSAPVAPTGYAPRVTRTLFLSAVAALTLLGIALRGLILARQPGLHADEAANGFDVLAVLAGSRPIFFPANTGREPLFIYFQSLLAAILGLSPFSLRLAGVLFAVATIPAIAFAATEVFRWQMPAGRARVAAIVSALVVTTSSYHLYFGGFGLRAISLPFFELLTIGLLWRGLRTGRTWCFALGGLLGGATMYTYLASRVFPIVALFLLLGALAVRPSWRRVAQAALAVLVWAAVFAPLGAYFLAHAAEATLRTDTISILAPENGGADPVGALAASLGRHLSVILPLANFDPAIGGPTRGPILNPAALVAAWLGAVVAIGWIASRRHPGAAGDRAAPWPRALPAAFFVVWIAVMSAPSIATVNTPNYMRMIGALPAFALLAGLGAEWAISRVAARGARLGTFLVAVGLLASTGLDLSAYWYGWLGTPKPLDELGIKYEAGQRLAALAAENRVFLAPLYYQDDAVRFGARARLAEIQTFDPRTPPVSVDRTAVYAFPTFDVEQPPILKARLGADLRIEEIRSDRSGKPLLTVAFAAPRAQQTIVPPLVSFADTIDLIEMRVEPATVKPGEPIRVLLTWRARGPIGDDYTIFTHLRRGASETVAQTDVRPGNGRSLTYNWRAGDVLLDEIVIVAPAGAAPGEYRVVAGLYRVANLQRLAATAGGKRVDGDEVEVGKVSISR